MHKQENEKQENNGKTEQFAEKKEWIKPEMENIEISSFGGGGSEAITGGRS